MHRTYSMRQSRAPTASQIQNPPPPSSTTKSGRFFGKAGLGVFLFFPLPFFSSFSFKNCPRIPDAGYFITLLERAFVSSKRAFRHTGFIQNILTPFLHSSLRRPFPDRKANRFFSRRCGPCFPQNHRRCLRPWLGEKTLPAREDGEERYAQHGARGKGEDGGCCKLYPIKLMSITYADFKTATIINLGWIMRRWCLRRHG